MRKWMVWLVLASVVVSTPAMAGLGLGGKVWVQSAEFSVGEDTLKADGVSVGPQASIDLGDSLWISASWLVGAFEWEDGADSQLSQDAEGVLAISFSWLDLGVGFRYSEDEFEDGDPLRRYGPMAYVGMGSAFGDSPFGWYAAGSWMFYDINDDWEWGEHYNVEAGFSCYLDPLSATVGYRYKDHYESDVDLTYQGITASLSISL